MIENAENYLYNSARNYSGMDGVLEIDFLWVLVFGLQTQTSDYQFILTKALCKFELQTQTSESTTKN